MPESSDNPAEERNPPSVASGKASEPVPPSPRTGRPGAGGEGGLGPLAPDAQIRLSDLMALARTLSGSGAETTEVEIERALISRQQRKFSKTAAGAKEEGGETPTADAIERPAAPRADADLLSSGEEERAAALPSMTLRTRRSRSSRGPGLLVPAAVLLTLSAIVAGTWFLVNLAQPRVEKTPLAAQANPAAAAPAEPPPMSVDEKELATVDKMIAAQRESDFPKALALATLLRSQGSRLPGLAYAEAQYAAGTGDYAGAALAINRSLELNEQVSECYILRAAIVARGRKPELVLRNYEAAAAADPYAPKAFFFWGEALRRAGRPQAALVRLEEAMLRSRDPDSTDFYQFKHRLTLVELNREGEFAEEMKSRLAAPAPAPDWILTAVAINLRQGDYAAAAGNLEKAQALFTPEQFASRLRDFYFFNFAHEPALAKFYAPILKPSPAPEPAASPGPSPGATEPAGAAVKPGEPPAPSPSPAAAAVSAKPEETPAPSPTALPSPTPSPTPAASAPPAEVSKAAPPESPKSAPSPSPAKKTASSAETPRRAKISPLPSPAAKTAPAAKGSKTAPPAASVKGPKSSPSPSPAAKTSKKTTPPAAPPKRAKSAPSPSPAP